METTHIETDRWILKKDVTMPNVGVTPTKTIYRLSRKEKFRVGLFKGCVASFDFSFQGDAEKVLTLVENLELLVETKLLKAIEDGTALRDTYFQTSDFSKKEYDKTSPASRNIRGGFGVHNQQIGL